MLFYNFLVLLISICYKLLLLVPSKSLDSLPALMIFVLTAAKFYCQCYCKDQPYHMSTFNMLMSLLVNTIKGEKWGNRKVRTGSEWIKMSLFRDYIIYLKKLNIIKIPTIRIRVFHILTKFKIRQNTK